MEAVVRLWGALWGGRLREGEQFVSAYIEKCIERVEQLDRALGQHC